MITYNLLNWLERDEVPLSRLHESPAHGSIVAEPAFFSEAATTGLLRLALSKDISPAERKERLTTLRECSLLEGSDLRLAA